MPAPKNTLKAALAAKTVQHGIWMNLVSPIAAEALAGLSASSDRYRKLDGGGVALGPVGAEDQQGDGGGLQAVARA